MYGLLLKTAPMASRGEKIAIARDEQSPKWSQEYLADKLAGRLDLTKEQWLGRIKNYESPNRRKTPIPDDHIMVIARVMGVDQFWMLTEDEDPIRWKDYQVGNATIDKSQPVVNEPRVPYYGQVPAIGFKLPERGNVNLDLDQSGVAVDTHFILKVRGRSLFPYFDNETQMVIERGTKPVPNVLNAVLSPDGNGELLLGQIVRKNARWMMHFARTQQEPVDVTDWQFLGHVTKTILEREGGISIPEDLPT